MERMILESELAQLKNQLADETRYRRACVQELHDLVREALLDARIIAMIQLLVGKGKVISPGEWEDTVSKCRTKQP